jgi:cytochrome c
MKKIAIALSAAALVTMAGQSAYAADAAAGEKIVATKCGSCHTHDTTGKHKVGPNLFGVVDRAPASAEGYKYSKGFEEAAAKGFSWDGGHLDKYLTDPTAFLREVSGDYKARSKMTFKLASEEDRANVIAYLETLK